MRAAFGHYMIHDISCCGTIFPQSAEALRKMDFDAGDYRSALDRFVAETSPELRKLVEAYYEDRGPQLREILPERMWPVLDTRLLSVLAATRRVNSCAKRATRHPRDTQ
jgi:hypothetical protein